MFEPIRKLRPLAKRYIYGEIADVLEVIGDRRPFAFRMNPKEISKDDLKKYHSIRGRYKRAQIENGDAEWFDGFIRSLDLSLPNIGIIEEKDLDDVLSGEKCLADVPFIHIDSKFVRDFFIEGRGVEEIHLRLLQDEGPLPLHYIRNFNISWISQRKSRMSVLNISEDYDYEYKSELHPPCIELMNRSDNGIFEHTHKLMEKVRSDKKKRKIFIESECFVRGAILRWGKKERAVFMKMNHIQTPDLCIRSLPLNEILSMELTKKEEKALRKKVEEYWEEPDEKFDEDDEGLFDFLNLKKVDWERSTKETLVFRFRNGNEFVYKVNPNDEIAYILEGQSHTYDYPEMKKKTLAFRKELSEWVFSPQRLERYMQKLEDALVEKGNAESQFEPYSREEAHAFVTRLDLNSIV